MPAAWIPRFVAVLLVLSPAMAARARLAVVVPEDDRGTTLEYRGDLPPDPEGAVTFGWSYVADLAPLVVVGARLSDECESRHSPVIDDAVDEALRLMTGLEADKAVRLLDRLVDDVPCLDHPATSAELADIFYYRSAALAFLGEDKPARASMRRAVAIEPALEADENLPPTINQMLVDARSARPDLVNVRLRFGDDVEVRLDGREGARELARDGLGLLQWRVDGRWSTARLRDLEDTVVVATPAGVRERLQYPDDLLQLRLASALGDALAGPLHIDRAVFWDGRDGAMLWDPAADETRWLGRYSTRGRRGDGRGRPLLDDDGDRTPATADRKDDPPRSTGLPDLDDPEDDEFPDDFEDPFLPDLDDPPRDDPPRDDGRRDDHGRRNDGGRAKTPKGPRDDRLRFTVGGGFMYLNPRPHALVVTDTGILIYGRLSLALRVDVGFPFAGYQRVTPLPLFGTGFRLRLGPRQSPVSPWLGLSFRGALENQNGLLMGLLGASAEVGVDFIPARHFIIRFAVDGGFLEQRGQVHAKIAVGFGV